MDNLRRFNVLTWIKAFLGKISLLNYTFWVDLGWGRYKFNEFVTKGRKV